MLKQIGVLERSVSFPLFWADRSNATLLLLLSHSQFYLNNENFMLFIICRPVGFTKAENFLYCHRHSFHLVYPSYGCLFPIFLPLYEQGHSVMNIQSSADLKNPGNHPLNI